MLIDVYMHGIKKNLFAPSLCSVIIIILYLYINEKIFLFIYCDGGLIGVVVCISKEYFNNFLFFQFTLLLVFECLLLLFLR